MDKEQLSLKARVDLEWDKILDLLAAQAVSAPGSSLCKNLRLFSEIDDIELKLEETSEMAGLLAEGGDLPLSPFPDLVSVLNSAEKGGILEPGDLIGISGFLGVTSDVKRYICRHETVPALHGIVSGIEELKEIKKEIDGAVDSGGNIKEDATPGLKLLMRKTQEFKMRTRERLKGMIHSPEYAEILQEPFFAERENRYVIPVKVEFKSRVEGIIHDLSASGATVFIEPKELVEMNNTLKMLELEVEDEIRNILASLSSMVSSSHQIIRNNLLVMAEIDCIYARARLSRILGGRGVKLNNKGIINIKGARHPLMVLTGKEAVPNDILIPEDTKILIISGPNSGGKTVLLKALGLFAMMVRGGLHLPCGEGSEMALFQEIYTDIGDDQDIRMGLSSFSAHISTIACIFRYGTPGSLILLDEIAISTDPSEGAAFAEAVLLTMRERGFKVIVTTHYNSLKTLGHSGQGFCNASFDLDLKTLSPTYNLVYGIPGRSFAIDIAGRFGIERGVIELALERLGRNDLSLDMLLSELNEKKRSYEEDSKRAKELRLEAEHLIEEQRDITSRLKESEKDIRKKMRTETNREISKARQEISGIIEGLMKDRRQERADSAKRLLTEIETGISNHITGSGDYIPLKDLKAGDHVEIKGLGIEGVLLDDHQEKRTIRVKVHDSEIKVNPALIQGLKQPAGQRIKAESIVRERRPPIPAEASALDLRGKSGEESIVEIDRFLDNAILIGIKEVSLIHGHGTGRLKKRIREHLKESPYALNYRPGDIYEGGDGVTVVELK